MVRNVLVVLFAWLFSSTIVIAQDNESYNIKRALEAMNNKDYEKANEYLTDEIKEYPNNGYAWLWHAALNMYVDEYGDALSDINKAINKISKRDKAYIGIAYSIRARIYETVDNIEKAIEDYSTAISYVPDYYDLYKNRAEIYYNLGQYDLSDKDYSQMILLDQGDVIGYMGIGRNAMDQERYKDAIEVFDFVIKLNKNYSSGYSFRAECLMALKDYNAAIDDIITAINIDNNEKAYYLMMNVADVAVNELVARLKIQCAKSQNRASWNFYLAKVFEHTKQYEKAIEQIKITSQIEYAPYLSSMISICYSSLGEYSSALKHINLAIEGDSTDYDYVMTKANILYDMGQSSEAITLLDKYINNRPDDNFGYCKRGFFKGYTGDTEGAIEDYTMSIVLNPKEATSYFLRGELYAMKGDSLLAKRDFEKVLELDSVPTSNSCAFYALLAIGEKEKAIEFINSVIEIDPSDAGIYYDAACLYSKMGESKKALEYLQIAFEKGAPYSAHIEFDNDLDNIRMLPEFIEICNKYKKESNETTVKENESNSYTEEVVEIPFTQEGGVYKVKCSINSLPLYFIFDTGASTVSISNLDAAFMLKNSYLKDSDIQGVQRYQTADGNISEGTLINLNNVEFGGLKLTDIRASVVNNQEAPLLLGQSVLKKLGRYEIDNNKKVIKIYHKQVK